MPSLGTPISQVLPVPLLTIKAKMLKAKIRGGDVTRRAGECVQPTSNEIALGIIHRHFIKVTVEQMGRNHLLFKSLCSQKLLLLVQLILFFIFSQDTEDGGSLFRDRKSNIS